MYEKERKESFRIFRIIENFISTTLQNFRLRVIENPKQEIIAGYTSKLRKNKLEEKSLFVECIARKRNQENKIDTKNQMTYLYEDIKKTAKKKKAQEITLFVHADETNLRHNYENLGFKIDKKCKVEKMYLMRARVKDFLNTQYFKTRKYKAAAGVDSILRLV